MYYQNEVDGMSTAELIPRIVLIACGSFSPPTLMHLRMFEIARDHFHIQGTHNVVGGLVSPTHDAYGKKGLIPSKHRYAMLKLALQSSNWIRVSDWEITQNEWSRTKHVLEYHQNFMNNYINSSNTDLNSIVPSWIPLKLRERKDKVQIKLVCGADLLESFAVPGLWSDKDIEDIIGNHGLVVISRSGANPEKFIFESDILTKYQKNITLVTNWVPNEVSSTMIRRLINRGQSVKYLIDDLVIEYIRRNDLFSSDFKYIIHHSPTDLSTDGNQSQFNSNYIKNTKNLYSADNNNSSLLNEEDMDETDNSIQNVLTINLDSSKNVNTFCCNNEESTDSPVSKKLFHKKPGQAVQVITHCPEGRNAETHPFEVKVKKLKRSPEIVESSLYQSIKTDRNLL